MTLMPSDGERCSPGNAELQLGIHNSEFDIRHFLWLTHLPSSGEIMNDEFRMLNAEGYCRVQPS